jgi:hypothetical protein
MAHIIPHRFIPDETCRKSERSSGQKPITRVVSAQTQVYA